MSNSTNVRVHKNINVCVQSVYIIYKPDETESSRSDLDTVVYGRISRLWEGEHKGKRGKTRYLRIWLKKSLIFKDI